MTSSQTQIAYIRNLENTFTDIDEQILTDKYDVQILYLKHKHPKYIISMWKAIQNADIVLAWFASWHSLPAFMMAAMLGKPRILITGGYDVANEPDINYGLRRGGLSYLISEAVFHLSSLALPFSETAYQETCRNTPLKPLSMKVLRLGVPDKTEFIHSNEQSPKEAITITIAGINHVSVRRKGVEEFVRAAQYAPDVRFIVIGKHQDDTIHHLQSIATTNVEFTGFLSDADLRELLSRASVYVQASYHEGFGLAVAEAMLARCIPVVSRNGSLPEVVGESGLYIDSIDPQSIAKKVNEALHLPSLSGEQARHRILENFSIQQRADGLYSIIDNLVKDE